MRGHVCRCRACAPPGYYPPADRAEGHVRARDQHRDGFRYRVTFCGIDVSTWCSEAVSGADTETGRVVLMLDYDNPGLPGLVRQQPHRCSCASRKICETVFAGETRIAGFSTIEAWEQAAG
jgi:hypothetical protein